MPPAKERHMDKLSTTSDNLEEADEDILTYTLSDEEIEAAASIVSGTTWYVDTRWPAYCC